jgi:glutathione S-transferase
MKLYFHPFSQHARRVRMVCEELGIVPELLPVALDQGEQTSPAFLRLNPAHAVPVMDDEGFVLSESHAIMRYLCLRHGATSLYPGDVAGRALVDQWLDWNHCRLNPPAQTLAIQLLFMKDKADGPTVERARKEARLALEVLDRGLEAKRGIGAAAHSLADISIGTTMALLAFCGETFAATPRAQALYQAQERLPSFIATRPPAMS